MNEMERLQLRVAVVERRLRCVLAALVLLVGVGTLTAMRAPQDVLRTRGLVITDAAGRERIVLGAPIGGASADPKLAHTVGLTVLDSSGRLTVSIGSGNPLVLAGGRTGSRISDAAGVVIYDPRTGQERGGFGAFSDGRANLCLDYEGASKEAVCLAVAPGDQYAAVILNGTPNEPQFDRVTMYVGADGAGSIKAFGGGENNGGVMIRAGKGPVPSVTVYDSAGKVVSDLARQP
jgi:hypothetical protein